MSVETRRVRITNVRGIKRAGRRIAPGVELELPAHKAAWLVNAAHAAEYVDAAPAPADTLKEDK